MADTAQAALRRLQPAAQGPIKLRHNPTMHLCAVQAQAAIEDEGLHRPCGQLQILADLPQPDALADPGAQAAPVHLAANGRSEERRVGKECRSRWSPYH